jgi:hypothetical protein
MLHVREEKKCVLLFGGEQLKERNHFVDLGIDGSLQY